MLPPPLLPAARALLARPHGWAATDGRILSLSLYEDAVRGNGRSVHSPGVCLELSQHTHHTHAYLDSIAGTKAASARPVAAAATTTATAATATATSSPAGCRRHLDRCGGCPCSGPGRGLRGRRMARCLGWMIQ